jgi:hypothetical protein
VPVAALFENVQDGAWVSQFVDWFPSVTLEQVRAVMEHAKRSALAPSWPRYFAVRLTLYSTVTDFARFRGLSTSVRRAMAQL